MYKAWLRWERAGGPTGFLGKTITSLGDLMNDQGFSSFVPDHPEDWFFDRLERLLDREKRAGRRRGASAKVAT